MFFDLKSFNHSKILAMCFITLSIFTFSTHTLLAQSKKKTTSVQTSKPQINPLDTKLIAAVKAKNVEEVNKLLVQGADANSIDHSNGFRVPILNVILSEGDNWQVEREIAIALINAGANVNGHGNTFYPPLMLADDIEVVKLLIKKSADVNFASTVSSLETPLHCAIYKPLITNLLIGAGANLNAKTRDGNTPLMYAIQRISNETDENGEVEADSEEDQDIKKCLESISLLLKAGADTKIKNREGKTALASARESKYAPLIKILEKVGVK